MANVLVNDMIAKAIDTNNAKLAGQIADHLRMNGENYDNILHRVQSVRPNVTADQWEALLYESESEET